MNELVKKMAAAVRWKDRDFNTVLIGAEQAVQVLWRRKLPTEDFFKLGRRENLYAAVILAARLARSGQMSEETAAAERKRAAEACREEYARLKEAGISVSAEAAEEESGSGTGSCSREATVPPSFLWWQEEMALLCAAAVFLGEDASARLSASLFAEKIADGEQAAAFSRRIFALFRYAPDELDCQIRLYQVFYDTFDVEWNTTVAYRQGVEILVPEVIPAKLKTLLLTALENGHMRYADQLLKLFLPVRLSQLDMTEEELMEMVFRAGSKELFRGVLFAEKMILQDAPCFLEGVNRWWSVLGSAKKEENENWPELRDWFEMYYLTRQVTAAPEQAQALLKDRDVLPPCKMKVRKTNMAQQDSFEALFWQENKCILKWLDVLGENNAFGFQPEEEYYPHYERNPSYDLTGAICNLIRQGCTGEEMLRIYMNTHLRSTYSINTFLRLVFAGGEEIEVLRGSEADVERYFAKYHLLGRVVKWNDSFGFCTQNICMGTKAVLFPKAWQRENEAFCKKLLEEGRPQYFHITRMNLNHFSLRGIPDEAPAADDGTAAFEKLCEELEEIVRAETLTTAQNKRISSLSFPRPLTKEQLQRLGLLTVDCCCALGKKPAELRYFINMINRMSSGQLNPWRHQAFRKQGGWYRFPDGIAEQVRDCWKKLTDFALSAEELFFVYINTPFKYCVTLSEMAESRCGEETDVLDIQKMLGGHTRYFFSGRIGSITPDNRQGKAVWLVSLLPTEFYRGSGVWGDLFYWRTENIQGYRTGMLCQFEIGSYRMAERVFIVKEVICGQDVRSTAARQVFLAAMNRAAYRKRLSMRDQGDLQVEVTGWSSQNEGKLALPMINGLKLRADNVTEVHWYLSMIEKSNPWRFSSKPVPSRRSWPAAIQGESVQAACRSLLLQFIEQYDVRSILRIYFNSALKSYLGFDTVITLCKTAGREFASLAIWMREYPLTVKKSEDRLTGVNFLTDGEISLEEAETEEQVSESGEYGAFFTDYDEETGVLRLKCRVPEGK
ncbi:MAG: hypothetical protein NC541_01435 [bacterium]|nr:hypothetical protein [bacterium]